MSARRFFLFPALACFLLVTPAAPGDDKKEPLPPFFATQSVSWSESSEGVVGVCNGAVLFERNRPVVCFGINKRPNDKGRYVYLLLFRTAPGDGFDFTVGGSSRTSSDETNSKTSLILEKKTIEVAYKFKADEKTHALMSEALTVGGKEVKEGMPRVFLVDLTQDKVTYEPVKVDLPDALPDLKDGGNEKSVTALHKAIDQLKAKSPEVKKFLEAKAEK